MSGYYALLGQQPSVMSIAQIAMEAKARRDAKEREERQDALAAQQAKDVAAHRLKVDAAAAADRQFERDTKLKEQKLGRERFDAEKAKWKADAGRETEKVSSTKIANARRWAAGMISGPEGYKKIGPALDVLRQTGADQGLNLPDVSNMSAGPEIQQAILASLQGSAASVLGPEDPVKPAPFTFEQEKELRRAGRSPGVTVNTGSGMTGLTTAQQTAQQGKLIDARQKLARLDQLDASIEAAGGHEALSSFWGGLEAEGKGLLSRAWEGSVSGEDMAKLDARGRAIADMGSLVNQTLSDLGGAHIPPAEFQRLTQGLPQPNDPAPVRKAKMASMRANLAIIDKFGSEALAEGLKTGKVGVSKDGLLEVGGQKSTPKNAGQQAAEDFAAEYEALGLP